MKFLKILFLFSFLIFCLFLFVPRSYDVPKMKPLSGVHYWDLPTGSKIAYVLKQGKGERRETPIIYLQGGPGGYISDKTNHLDFLTGSGYDVYLYDQIGSGHSARLSDINEYTAIRHKKDLEAIVQKIGKKQVILVGQSWGAILATLYISDNTNKVKALILTGPASIVPINYHLANVKSPDSLNLKSAEYSNRMANEKTNNVRTRFVALWARLFGSKLASDKEMDAFQTVLDEQLSKATVTKVSNSKKVEGGGGYYVQIKTVESFEKTPDPRPRLKNTIPTLILKGQYDNQKWGFLTEYLQMFQNHSLKVIPNAGHSIYKEQPELYVQHILEFLAFTDTSM